MKRTKLVGTLAALSMAAFCGPAWASTWLADCNAGTVTKDGGAPVTGLNSGNTLGFSLLGTPTGPGQITPGPVAGDLIEINGTCIEDVTVRTPGLTLANHTNSGSLNTADGVEGQLEIAGAGNTVIDGILIGKTSAFSFGGAVAEVANLFVHDGAAAAIKNSQVSHGPLVGILAARSSEVDVQDTTVSNNGSSAPDDNSNMGILAASNGTVYLGKTDGTAPVTVQNNSGAGLVAADASSLVIYGAIFSGNGLQQIALYGASSGFLTGVNTSSTQITATSGGCCQAIFAAGASTLDVEQGVTVTGNQTKAAIGLNGSTLLLQGSTVTSGLGAATPAKSEATLHGTGNSVIALAGGNVICFGAVGAGVPCNITSGGAAFTVDHVSTLLQVSAGLLGYPQLPDNAGGGGQVILQSTVDLGRGLVSATPSLSWVTGSANIAVAQNSSFRLQGGVNVTGQLTLAQGANGFFNKSAGGTNTISSGIVCNFTTVPAAHLVGPTAVSPTPTLAASMSSATPGQCLPF